MALTRSAIGWHVGSMAAGGIAVFSAMATQQVDVYAIWNAMNKIVADVTTLLAALAPIAAIFGAAYRTWNAKQVPSAALVVDVGSPSKAETDAEHPPGNSATVQTIGGTAAGKIVGALLIGIIVICAIATPSLAQPNIIQNLAKRNDVNAPGGVANSVGSTLPSPDQLIQKLQAINLADFTYAKAKAKASNNVITLPCWSAWVDLLTKAQQPLVDDKGQPLTKPDPHLFSDIEDASELLQALQNGGPIQTGCAAMADAAKKSVVQVIGAVIGGGGAAGLLPALPF